MYTHYPVPSEVKVNKELERTRGVDMILYYSHAPRHEQKHRLNMSYRIISDIKVSHVRNEMLAKRLPSTWIDAIVLVHRSYFAVSEA